MNRNQRAALANPNLEFGASTFLGIPVGPKQMLQVFQDNDEQDYYEKKVLYNCNDGGTMGPQGRSDLILIVLPSNIANFQISEGFLASRPVLKTIVGIEDLTVIPVAFCPECTVLEFSRLNATIISESAFIACEGLKRVELPNAITVRSEAFANCVNATIVLNDNVEDVHESSFNNVDNLIYHGSLPGAPWGATKWNGVPQN